VEGETPCFAIFTPETKKQENSLNFMISDKFRTGGIKGILCRLTIILLIHSAFSCTKNAGINANKSFIALSNVAYGTGTITLYLSGTPLGNPLGFGESSGMPGNPYDTSVSTVSLMSVMDGMDTLLNGYAAFQQNAYYSIFAYDSVVRGKVGLLTLQDFLVSPPVETNSCVRFLNFVPGAPTGFILTNADTTLIPTTLLVNVARNPLPGSSNYDFKTNIPSGTFEVFAYRDSARYSADSSNIRFVDSLTLDPLLSYNVCLQGFFDSASGTNKLTLKSIRLN